MTNLKLNCWRSSSRWIVTLLATALLALQPASALACAVCYGDPDSGASKGLTWAIMALAGIVVCVLAGIASFFVAVSRRATVSDQNQPTQT